MRWSRYWLMALWVIGEASNARGAGAEALLPRAPNILVILTDQQHAGMMSCAGNGWLKTPNMDRLAATGIRFERAYSANPVCSPSRFAMFTGQPPSVVGMEANGQPTKPLPAVTMGALFRQAGYQTVYGGKRHLPGWDVPSAEGKVRSERYGFDEYLTQNERQRLSELCVRFLLQKHDRPFLLVASFINPHDICFMAIMAARQETLANEDFLKEFGLKRPEGLTQAEFIRQHCPPLPANFEIPQNEPEGLRGLDWRPFRAFVRQHWTEEDWRLHRWSYARLTERVDGEVGAVLQALRQSGAEDNTLVVFTSDHGDMDSAHRLEHKSMPYEEAMRVPFILSGAGVPRAGRVDGKHLVSAGLDLLPTLCDFAGIQIPSELKGRSVRGLVRATPPADWRKSLVIENENSRIVHLGGSKYVVFAKGRKREQFMDLTRDPGEMKNVAYEPAYQGQVRKCRKLLKDWYAAQGLKLDPKYIVVE